MLTLELFRPKNLRDYTKIQERLETAHKKVRNTNSEHLEPSEWVLYKVLAWCVYWGYFAGIPTYSAAKCMCKAVKGITFSHAAL